MTAKDKIMMLIGFTSSADTVKKYCKVVDYAGEKHVLVPVKWLDRLSDYSKAANDAMKELP